MADYPIVCVEKENGHIAKVGIGTDPKRAVSYLTLADVRSALKRGDKFHTESKSGKRAYVEAFEGIRTRADDVKDDNLDNLRICYE